MTLLSAIRREEKKLDRQLGKLQKKLDGVRAAAQALGSSADHGIKVFRKRVLSEAGRAKIAKAARRRWARVRAQAKKAGS